MTVESLLAWRCCAAALKQSSNYTKAATTVEIFDNTELKGFQALLA